MPDQKLWIRDTQLSGIQIVTVLISGVCRRLVELLMHTQHSVVSASLRAVGNIVTGDDIQTQVRASVARLFWLTTFLKARKDSKLKIRWGLKYQTRLEFQLVALCSVSYGVRFSIGVPFQTKPLEIGTKWATFCSDFGWFGFGMVGTIAISIAITNQRKSEL